MQQQESCHCGESRPGKLGLCEYRLVVRGRERHRGLQPHLACEPPLIPARAGLRALQGRRELERLIRRCQVARDSAGPWGAAGPPPLLVKVRRARRALRLPSQPGARALKRSGACAAAGGMGRGGAGAARSAAALWRPAAAGGGGGSLAGRGRMRCCRQHGACFMRAGLPRHLPLKPSRPRRFVLGCRFST